MSIVVNQPYSTAGNGGRKLVRLSNGTLVSALIESGTTLRVYKSTDNGQSWSLIYTYGAYESVFDVSIVSNINSVHMLIAQKNVATPNLLFRTIDENGVLDANKTKLIENTQTALGNVSLAIDPTNGHLHAAWSSKNNSYPNGFNIRYSKSTDGGVTWSAVEQVTSFNNYNIYYTKPTVSIYNGNPVIIYENLWSPSYSIGVVIHDGTTWKFKTLYNGGSYPQSSPSAVVDIDGVIAVIWDKGKSNGFDVGFSKSTDGGITWSTVKLLDTGTSGGTITTDKTGKYVVVHDGAGGGKLVKITSTDKGETWNKSTPLGNGFFVNPTTLYDQTFSGEFGEYPPTIYRDTDSTPSIEYIGTYTTNQAPTLALNTVDNQTLYENDTLTIPTSTSFTIKMTASDEDIDQTLQYSVSVGGVERIPLTAINRDTETLITIDKSHLIVGMNTVVVTVRDSEGGETSLQFNIVVDANMPIDPTCLANMKFNGYSLSTISLAELVNHLE